MANCQFMGILGFFPPAVVCFAASLYLLPDVKILRWLMLSSSSRQRSSNFVHLVLMSEPESWMLLKCNSRMNRLWKPAIGNDCVKKKASKPLADYASDLDTDPLVIKSNNKPVAALVSIKDTDRESLALGLSAEFGKIIRRARAEAKKGKVFSLKQVKEELLSKRAEPGKVRTTARGHRHSGRKKSSGRG